MFFFRNSAPELLVGFTVAGIEAAITDHFKVFFRDVSDQTCDEINHWDGFFNVGIVFMTVVMEGDIFTIIVINAGSSDNGSSKVTSNIFDNCFWVAFAWLCVDIESMFVVFVAQGLGLFKGRADNLFHFIEKGSAEGISEKSVVKVVNIFPETVIAETAFGQEAVDMWVPFQIPAKSVED